jgi:hypothetical protein
MFSCHKGKLSIEQQTDAIRSHHLVLGLAQENSAPTPIMSRRLPRRSVIPQV